jgi:hypothetical protein
VQIRQVPVALADVEAVADEELVGHREADVADGQVVDEAPVRPVEQGGDGERGRPAEPERLPEVVQRQAGVDDVLDEQDMAVRDLGVQVLEQADPGMAAEARIRPVARELDEIERVGDRDRPREVGEEDDARLQRRDEQRLAAGVVAGDLPAELGDARRELLAREVNLADVVSLARRYDASSRRYRCARRSISRL